MREVTQEYLNAVLDYSREWHNRISIFSGVKATYQYDIANTDFGEFGNRSLVYNQQVYGFEPTQGFEFWTSANSTFERVIENDRYIAKLTNDSTPTSTYSNELIYQNGGGYPLTSEHKMYYRLFVKGTTNKFNFWVIQLKNSGNDNKRYSFSITDEWQKFNVIETVPDGVNTGRVEVAFDINETVGSVLFIDKIVAIDLTEMFGEGNEPDLEHCEKIFEDNDYSVESNKQFEQYSNAEISMTETMSDSDNLTMGQAFSKEARIKIYNPEYTDYDNKKIAISCGIVVDGNIKDIVINDFYVYEATSHDEYETIDIVAYDKIQSLSEQKFEPIFPTPPETDMALLFQISSRYGVRWDGDNPALNVPINYTDGTVAEQLGWVAGLQGKNAVINSEGNLEFRWYESPPATTNRWQDFPVTWAEMTGTWGDYLDEGTTTITRSEQKERGVKISYKPCTIRSVTSGTSENVVTVGSGKGIVFENPYMTQELLEGIGNKVIGKSYMSGEVNTFGNPMYEVGDIVSVQDKKLDVYTMYICNINWNLIGGCFAVYHSINNENSVVALTPSQTQRGAKATEKVAANVPQSTEKEYPTVEEFNALLTSLKNAGIMQADKIIEK